MWGGGERGGEGRRPVAVECGESEVRAGMSKSLKEGKGVNSSVSGVGGPDTSAAKLVWGSSLPARARHGAGKGMDATCEEGGVKKVAARPQVC